MFIIKIKQYAKPLLWSYLTIILLLDVLPINGTNSTLNNNYIIGLRWDYLIHALVYIPMFSLLIISTKLKHQKLKLLILSLTIAVALEGLQYLIPWRTFNVNDLVGNGVGVLLGWLVITVFGTHLMKISKTKHKYQISNQQLALIKNFLQLKDNTYK